MTDTIARPLPWDVMGTALTPKATTVPAVLKETGLDYQVSVRDAFTDSSYVGAGRLMAPTFQALVRPMPDGSEKVLAFTKKRYTPIQNHDGFAVADYLVSEFGACISGAADYRGGDRSLLAVTLPDTIQLHGRDGDDPVDLHLVITNDHAGNAALTLALTPVRIECTNALPAAMREAQRVWKISHTPKAQARLDLAADAIKRALEYRDAFQEQAQAMLDTEMVDAEFRKMVARLYPTKGKGDRAAEQAKAVQSELFGLWSSSPTMDGIRGTRWAGYNAVTEYLDHYRPVRSEPTVARAEGALDGPYVRQKAKLWELFSNA